MPRRPSSLQRACAAALTVLWLALPLLGLLHAGEHAHRFCAEHQAFEELDGEATQASARAQGPERGEREELERAAGAGDTHERCALAWAEPRRAWFQAPGVSLPVLEPRALLMLDVAAGSGSGVPLLALAPKSSPPSC